MVTFPKYESYKDSGVEWIGEIPAHWEVKRLKHIAKINPLTNNLEKEEQITFLPMEAVSEIGSYELTRISKRKKFSDSLTNFEKYDVILAKITPCFENGKCAYLKDLLTNRGIGSTEFHVFRANKQIILPEFLYYLVFNPNFRLYAEVFMVGSAGHKRITTPFIANSQFSVPTAQEQDRIAAFLDEKTREIDDAIAKKQQLIELLQEQKTILINNAVTKGLKRNVPMKESGVEWIGEIPAHWGVKKLKYFTSVQSGLTLGKSYSGKNVESYPYLRVANVQDGYFKLHDIAKIRVPSHLVSQYLVRSGDILVTEGGDIDKLGRGTVWEGQIDNCLHQNHIFAIRVNETFASKYFVSLVMGADYGRKYFTQTANKTTNLASTNKTKLGNFPLALPPIEEQIVIADHIGQINAEFESILSKVSSEIKRLHELKVVLIAEAVTGKIKV